MYVLIVGPIVAIIIALRAADHSLIHKSMGELTCKFISMVLKLSQMGLVPSEHGVIGNLHGFFLEDVLLGAQVKGRLSKDIFISLVVLYNFIQLPTCNLSCQIYERFTNCTDAFNMLREISLL